MTREEKQKAIYVLNNTAPVFPLKKPEEYNVRVQTIKQIIDWLEQEPVIDKIRAEIKDWQTDIHDNEYDADKYDFVFERIFEIIDEYKSEREE